MAPVKKKPHRLGKTHLREWRTYRNLSQEAAASRLEVSRTLLSKVENAKSPYTQQLLEKAALAYGVEVVDLLIRNPLDTNAVWSIQDQLLKATPDVQRQAVAVVETILRTGTRG
jgi:transcriptional regulator with XRE-family HTH domain